MLLFFLFLLSAFFSGSETALMTLNRYRMRHLANEGHAGAINAKKLLDKPDRLIGLILLGNNFVNIVIIQIATYLGFVLYGEIGVAIATGLLTLLILIFAELAPKTLAALHAEKIAYPAALIYKPLLTITYPLIWTINLFANSLLRLFGLNKKNVEMALNREELRSVVFEAQGRIPNRYHNMLLSILDLEKETVEDIMVPRNEIVGIDISDDWDEILDQLKNPIFTRLPVYKDSVDNIQGVLHIRRILPLIISEELTLDKLHSALRDAYYIPTGTTLNQQLVNFQREKRRIGLIVDEYGDIQGLVTLEDLLEEIVGEFTSDPNTISTNIYPQKDGTFLLDGSLHVREINKMLGYKFHANGPRTMNGLVLEHMEQIPGPGTSMLIDGYPVEIIKTSDNIVKTVRISPRLKNHLTQTSHNVD